MMRTASPLLLIALACSAPEGEPQTASRQDSVAAVGRQVMPFDLDRTTHVFQKTESGGLQHVFSDDGDAEQIRLVRAHLEEEAAKFAQGDFHDPEMIHGNDMAGLHALVMGFERLVIVYSDTEEGGQISYSSEDAGLVTAIHEWFDAQLSDHGHHAQPNH